MDATQPAKGAQMQAEIVAAIESLRLYCGDPVDWWSREIVAVARAKCPACDFIIVHPAVVPQELRAGGVWPIVYDQATIYMDKRGLLDEGMFMLAFVTPDPQEPQLGRIALWKKEAGRSDEELESHED